MKPFLKEVAEKIFTTYPKLEQVTLVFPNRRAILYFRKYLGELLTKPAFSPELLTIEEFIAGFSTATVPDKLELISRLHVSYHQIVRIRESDSEEATQPEPFDQFYFWGDMLLRDFDEADRYLVNAGHLFKDLSHQKELDSSFDFLTDEQREFLRSFWINFDENQSLNKKRFLQLWRKLPLIYEHFRKSLTELSLAYEGMLHRSVAEKIAELAKSKNKPFTNIHFCGFNALTGAEERIISHFVEHYNAEVLWDIDEYYVNNDAQEAGRYFREYQDHKILRKTFTSNIPANLLKKKTDSAQKINLFGASQPIGQAKLMAEVLQSQLANLKPEETLIVLPDEKLLMPVLHGISGMVEKLNVTMGFPLGNTPLFNLIELLIDLQLNAKNEHFNHRQVLAILGHPYVITADTISANNKRKEILKHNWVNIPAGFLATEVDLHRIIFKQVITAQSNIDSVNTYTIRYLKQVTEAVGGLSALTSFDKEYAFHFLKFFNRLEEIITTQNNEQPGTTSVKNENADNKKEERERNKKIQGALKSLLRLLRQLVNSNKIPFTGEPLVGLQVMGVLETRNLDFKNVFILSLNEGSFPAISSKGSYIPFNIRKAYNLPTTEHQDAMYAYLFYRILQRAENINLFYNSETDVLGQGEMSRYLQQLIFESGIPVERKVLHNSIQPIDINPITVQKTENVLEEMMKLNDGNPYFQGISPSALNTYMECRLKFYFRHIARIKEPNEVEEELDARVLGNFLHDVMEKFYKGIIEKKKVRLIEAKDFDQCEQFIDHLIDQVFINEYRLEPGKPVTYEGQRLVVREIIKRFAHRIIEMDKHYAPFVIEALEYGGITHTVPVKHAPFKAVLSGKIDRIDRKDDLIRIIDYKTGKDKLDFESVASLFLRDTKRNKAAFQTLLYAMLYKKSNPGVGSSRLLPGLINRLNLFDEEFSFGLKLGKEQITNADPLLTEFEHHIQQVFEELYDPSKPFDQTTDTDNCKLCPYGPICYR